MPLTELDINKWSRLIFPHVDQVTCMECCKYYLAPSTAPCGHTLCHVCWTGRKQCASCGAAVIRKSLKLNLQLQKITEHTQGLKEEFEKNFKVNFDEYLLHTSIEKEFNKDPTKNVRDWLANSENQFSAPEASQQNSTQYSNNQQKEIGSKVQIHSETSKTLSTKNVIHIGIPQDDWDKIEEMPDTGELYKNNKENVIGPMDIEPYAIDPSEFTPDNPRRSSRKRDVKGNMLPNYDVMSVEQSSLKKSTKDSDSKVSKQNWANVKRMKKEFSKLNKKTKNKLNVSIEMCKKSVLSANKKPPLATVNNSEEHVLHIDDNTPNILYPKESVINDVETAKILNDIECETQMSKNVKHIDRQNDENIKSYNISNTSQCQPANVNEDQAPPVAFIVKGAFQPPSVEKNNDICSDHNQQTIVVNTDNVEQTGNSEDIEITIKIGNTVTNICIKKKEQDVKLKINADREIQTTLEKYVLDNENIASCPVKKGLGSENSVAMNGQNKEHKTQQIQKCMSANEVLSTNKTPLSKKNTESADTATVQYVITESIEKELSKEMDKDAQNTQSGSKTNNQAIKNKPVSVNNTVDEDCLNDLDLFDNDSVKEGNVQSLKSTSHAPSEILISTMKSNRSRKQIDKRVRDATPNELPISKKLKLINENNEIEEIGATSKAIQSNNFEQDSELNTYDLVMGKVFASIDLDLAKKDNNKNFKNSQFVETEHDNIATPHSSKARQLCDSFHGQSENVFSLLEKDTDLPNEFPSGKTQTRIAIQEEPSGNAAKPKEVIDQDLCTPLEDKDNDHSDESIVEETPQKNASFQKVKQKSGGSLKENTVKNKSLKLKRTESAIAQKSSETPNIMSVINLSDITDDTTRKNTHVTVLEAPKCRPTLETPLTITNFVEQIKHKSTPMAKKSLNFDNESALVSDVDLEQTLCPSVFVAAKTTQEKEFLHKAFEDSPVTRAKSPLIMRCLRMRTMKYCLAGSCLSPSEISNVKLLCSMRKWDYVDKYTKELTHLVVGVDEENKSQRSVKYMCALAASKWIVSYDWVQTCLQMKKVVDEEPYEALDNTGEPGPQRSRLAPQKLFQGITFFCMLPFSVLDVHTLKGMLEAAGGRVVDEVQLVRVTHESNSVALLLAEPEHTQENRFTYIAMELSIVPVNSEWVLNCLGSYTIGSILELLLCPESLLPPATANWPTELMARDFD